MYQPKYPGFTHLKNDDRIGSTYDRHTRFNRETLNSRATVLDYSTSSACCTNLTDDVEDDVFAADTGCKLAFHFNAHIFAAFCYKGLGRQHMFYFRSADAECQSTKCAMRSGMRVTCCNSRLNNRLISLLSGST